MSEWTGTRTPPSDEDGVYIDHDAEFSTVIIGGELLSIRNEKSLWSRDLEADLTRAHRIADAMGARVFVLRKDWRRSLPFRWEADQ